MAFRSPPPPLQPLALKLGRNPTLVGRGGFVSRRDHNQAYRRSTQLTGGTNYAEATNSNASRSSGGSAREGKDSHSRQWRLSMAVFLNRNKQPLAAPIEVAELLSEKPPPSHKLLQYLSAFFGLRGGAPAGDGGKGGIAGEIVNAAAAALTRIGGSVYAFPELTHHHRTGTHRTGL